MVKRLFAVILSVALLFFATPAFSTVIRNTLPVSLTMDVNAWLTTGCNLASMHFAFANAVGGIVPADVPIVCTTSWGNGPATGYTQVSSGVFFDTATALANGSATIPTGKFLVGKALNPSLNCGAADNSCFNDGAATIVPLTSANYNSSVQDTLYMAIDTNGLSITAGQYTGHLNYTICIS